jgi:hypothetical protein
MLRGAIDASSSRLSNSYRAIHRDFRYQQREERGCNRRRP